MSEHHYNHDAWHDPALWAWSEREGRWVRCTDAVIPADAWAALNAAAAKEAK